MSTQDPKSDATLAALHTAVMALAYAAEKLPEVQKAYDDVSAAIDSAVQQAAEAVGLAGVRAALHTDWSDPAARQPLTDEQAEAIIEDSGGRWVDGEFRIDGPDLMRMLHTAHGIGTEGGAA